MANADFTLANLATSKAFDFVTISSYLSSAVPKQFSAYIPVILMDGEYDDELDMNVGKSISLEPLPSKEAALEAARVACLLTIGAIGYTAKVVEHE